MRTPNIGNLLGASFWFLPTVLLAGAAVTALGLVELEEHLGAGVVRRWPFLVRMDPETARSVLSTIATTMATVAATTFSLTIVALTLAAQQYTPRMLHNYISNRGNQLTLGVLAGTFAYALLVLRSVRNEPDVVPAMALTGALVLAFLASGLGFTINVRQQALLGRAAVIPPPAGFVVAEGPTGLGYCGWFALVCDRAEVVWSYAPTAASTGASNVCGPFLEWARGEGVSTVFVVPASEWRSWYDEYADGLYGKAGERTYPVDSREALRVCSDIVGNPPGPEAPLSERLNLVGTTAQDNQGEIFVAQLTRPMTIPDGSDDPGRGPFMIAGSLHAR